MLFKLIRFERHAFAAHVHVRLEGIDPRVAGQAEVAVRPDHAIRRNIQLIVGNITAPRSTAPGIWDLALGIKLEGDGGLVMLLATDREVVHVESKTRSPPSVAARYCR